VPDQLKKYELALKHTLGVTVAEHLQAPAEDSAFPAPVIHRSAPLWLIREFGAIYKYSDSTQLKWESTGEQVLRWTLQKTTEEITADLTCRKLSYKDTVRSATMSLLIKQISF